jgi:uncharacterized protein YdaU (DUF1376 family)
LKHPYIQFYVGDWLKDPELSMCSPATRGIWIDLICAIHEGNGAGKLTANRQQLSRICRCTEPDISAALIELGNTNAADIYEADGIVSITCRRIRRARELSLSRQQAGSKGAAKTIANREQNPDNDNEDGILRVREFARERGISEKDADWFYWKGRGNGWTNGGKPMRDWKATLLSWQRAGYLPSQKQSNNGRTITFQKAKEPAPLYPKLPPAREVSEEELAAQRKIVRECSEKLKQELNK